MRRRGSEARGAVRVVEVIPGKSVIGLEIPNHHHELVALRDIRGAPEYEGNPSPLTLTLGMDIGVKPVAVDLAKVPHLLGAGTTGAGPARRPRGSRGSSSGPGTRVRRASPAVMPGSASASPARA